MRFLATAVVVLIAAACASPTPPTPAPSTTATANATPGVVASTATSPTLASPTPTPVPSGLHVGGLATVVVDQLRQMADPNDPKSHAHESPGPGVSRSLIPLKRDHLVYLLDDQTIDGVRYWKVADGDYIGCCAPFGWVAASENGADTLAPSNAECPSGRPLTSSDLLSLGQFGALVCFGGADLTIDGFLNCSQPVADAPAFVQSPWEADPVYPLSCSLDNRLYWLNGVALRPFVDHGHVSVIRARLTGHLDDPASSDCVWVEGDMGNIVPQEGGPLETADFNCRLTLVVTDVAPE